MESSLEQVHGHLLLDGGAWFRSVLWLHGVIRDWGRVPGPRGPILLYLYHVLSQQVGAVQDLRVLWCW